MRPIEVSKIPKSIKNFSTWRYRVSRLESLPSILDSDSSTRTLSVIVRKPSNDVLHKLDENSHCNVKLNDVTMASICNSRLERRYKYVVSRSIVMLESCVSWGYSIALSNYCVNIVWWLVRERRRQTLSNVLASLRNVFGTPRIKVNTVFFLASALYLHRQWLR